MSTIQPKKKQAQKNAKRVMALFDSQKATVAAKKATVAAKKATNKAAAAAKAAAKALKGAKKPAAKKPAAKKKRMTREAALKKARRARRVTGKHSSSARQIVRKATTAQRRGIGRAYMSARSVSSRVKKGHIKGADAQLARSYGLTRINPSNKAVWGDLKSVLPMVGAGAGAFVGMTVLGAKAVKMLAPKLPAGTPVMISRNIAPITTGGLTVLAWWALKRSKGMQKWSFPVLMGGGVATVLQLMLHSEMGQKLAAQVGLMPSLTPALGSYTTVPGYMGDYVDAGPQEAFGAYVTNDYPLHTPGPGDNDYTMATLGEYGYGEEFMGALELTETPGGTSLSGVNSLEGSAI